MTAYVVFCLTEVTDQDAIKLYRKTGGPSLAAYGGRFVAGPNVSETLEGAPLAGAVVTAFDTLDQAKTWYHSPEYQAAVPIRQGASAGIGFIVESRG